MDKNIPVHTEHLLEFVENLLKENGIPVCYLKNDADIEKNVDMGLRAGILEEDSVLLNIQTFMHHIKSNTLYFITDLFQCNYVVFRLPDTHTVFHCGPVLWESVSKEQVRELLTTYDIPLDFETALTQYYREVPLMTCRSFYENLFTELASQIFGEDFATQYSSYEDMEQLHFRSPELMEQTEAPFSRIDLLAKRYELENEIIHAVLSGKEVLVLEIAEKSMDPMAELPSRVSNQLRNRKNYMLSFNTLLRKSIELNGVHPIYCDATSGEFAVEIEKCTSIEQLNELCTKMLITYCKIAKKTSHLDHSPFVDTVLTYIEADLRADLSLKALSSHLNVNASYLSALFSEEMGISLTNYVTKCRMEQAAKLLTHSNMSVKNIAFQCGFTDIHYFSRQFKKYTELSPKAYREKQALLPDLKLIHQLKKKKK